MSCTVSIIPKDPIPLVKWTANLIYHILTNTLLVLASLVTLALHRSYGPRAICNKYLLKSCILNYNTHITRSLSALRHWWDLHHLQTQKEVRIDLLYLLRKVNSWSNINRCIHIVPCVKIISEQLFNMWLLVCYSLN